MCSVDRVNVAVESLSRSGTFYRKSHALVFFQHADNIDPFSACRLLSAAGSCLNVFVFFYLYPQLTNYSFPLWGKGQMRRWINAHIKAQERQLSPEGISNIQSAHSLSLFILNTVKTPCTCVDAELALTLVLSSSCVIWPWLCLL